MKTKPPRPHKRKITRPKNNPRSLLYEAESAFRSGDLERALPSAQEALSLLLPNPKNPTPAALPALKLVAEINIELGNPSTAREHFLTAVALDPDGSIPESEGGGAEKFLWLAQLSEEGGRESVEWFEKGAEVLRRQIVGMVGGDGEGEAGDEVEGLIRRLASALCGIVEVYMTDLSWEPDAESLCEKLITEALLAAPNAPEPLQTLASIRISQSRIPEAKKALSDSLALWKDLPNDENLMVSEMYKKPEDPNIPDFPTRISLARLLMEVEMEEDALMVVGRLVRENDQSVEAWYLGGWCQFLVAQKQRQDTNGVEEKDNMTDNDNVDSKAREKEEEKYTESLVYSRKALRRSLKLYKLLEYEDDRLRDHAMELVEGLDKELEGRDVDSAFDEVSAIGSDWESEEDEGDQEDQEDEEMKY